MSADATVRKVARRRRANVKGGRQHKHEVWVSAEEEAELLIRSNASGMTIPRYLMERALSSEGGETTTDRRNRLGELLRMRRLLAADSNNLNQLARRANSGESMADLSGALEGALGAVTALLDTLDGVLREEAKRS